MRNIQRAALALLAATLIVTSACGDSTGPAVARNEPGTGSSTLRVVADIDASGSAGSMSTDYLVTVRDAAGARVSGASVTIQNAFVGTLTLSETGVGSGDYFASRLDFPGGDFRLDVIRGSDNVRSVVLGGPGVHAIVSPTTGSTATAGQPMTVRWNVPSRARMAEVENSDFGPFTVPDTGAFTIGGAFNPARPDQEITVSRYNEVDIAGGILGSRMRVTVESRVRPVSVQ
ncbi:MAG: hypothetical protein ABR499_04445 [Gemmatimonadaceae bacterium]